MIQYTLGVFQQEYPNLPYGHKDLA